MAYEEITSRNLSKGFSEVLIYLNDVTNSWFGNMFLITVWSIITFAVYNNRNDFGEAVSSAGFVLAIIGVFFWISGAISAYVLTACIGSAIFGFIWLLIEKRN